MQDPYTSSPRMSPIDRPAKRTASVSERISQRFKELRKNPPQTDDHSSEGKLLSPPSPVFSAGKSEAGEEEVFASINKDKGKGKEVSSPPQIESPAPLSPQALSTPLPILQQPGSLIPRPPAPIVLAGLALSPRMVSQLMTRAASEMPLRNVRFPILGEYPDCFTGEELVTWLKENVEGFGGSLDRAEDAAVDLTEREGALRRIGELGKKYLYELAAFVNVKSIGNRFENSRDAYFQFRPKVKCLANKRGAITEFLQAFEFHFTPDELPEQHNALTPVAENLMKRTSTFVSIVQKAVSAAGSAGSEPFYVRARREAEEADRVYRIAVRKLDRQRLGLEEKIEETLKTLQRYESERLRAVKTGACFVHVAYFTMNIRILV